MPWAIVELKKQLFAIATEDMREMVLMPEVATVPDVPDYIRGVINLRGKVLPVLDLRKRMGFSSALEETEGFCALMGQREQDHRNWLMNSNFRSNNAAPSTWPPTRTSANSVNGMTATPRKTPVLPLS